MTYDFVRVLEEYLWPGCKRDRYGNLIWPKEHFCRDTDCQTSGYKGITLKEIQDKNRWYRGNEHTYSEKIQSIFNV